MIRIVFLIFILVSHAAYGAETDAENQVEKNNSVEKEENGQPGNSQQQPDIWPKPFQPSEQVGADSQISFPTDI